MTDTATLPAAELARLEAQFPARAVAVRDDTVVSVRECGEGGEGALPVVCLHGIGSGSASWLDAALLLGQQSRVIAWDAPGYGASTPLPQDAPCAADYAQRLHALLEAMGIARCVLVGHSLGAIMAAAAVKADRAGRFAALALVSPAQGYGAPGREAERAQTHAQRMAALNELGIAGMAAQRSQRLVSEYATPLARQWVQWNMARLHERGYRQAIELLSAGDLLADLPVAVLTHVACGAQDTITPPEGCASVAARCGAELHLLDQAGHACYVEQPEAAAQWLGRILGSLFHQESKLP